MPAIYGAQAQHDQLDAPKIAGLRRGGMLPQAYVYPAEMRATRDRRRRRRHRTRQRAELLTHVHQTNGQYNLPAMGQQSADQANRAGAAERWPDPAVPKSIEVDLALSDYDDPLLRALELTSGQTATPHAVRRCPGCRPSLAWARASGSGSWMPYRILPAARAGRISWPIAAWSHVRRRRQASIGERYSWCLWAAPPPPLDLTGAWGHVAPLLRRTVCGARDVARAQKTMYRFSALAMPMAGDPQEGCGAAAVAHQPTDMQPEHVARGGRRLA